MQNQNAQSAWWGAGPNSTFPGGTAVYPPFSSTGVDQNQLLNSYQQLYGNAATSQTPTGFDPTQWTAAQLQHWQQWQQWQEKYQQWQEQYGKKYAESVAAMQSAGLTVPAFPPPITQTTKGVETNPPLPPSSQPIPPPPPDEEKPPLPSGPMGKDDSSDYTKDNPEDLSEAEKTFDIQFKQWEGQFNEWKKQNQDHPDKTQYREYEKKWESWREQLLQRRAQMRRKRLNKTVDSGSETSAPGVLTGKVEIKAKPVPAFGAGQGIEKPPEPEYSYKTQNQPPPPANPYNVEPLKFENKPLPYTMPPVNSVNITNVPAIVQNAPPDVKNPPPSIPPTGGLMKNLMDRMNPEPFPEQNRQGNFPSLFDNQNFNRPPSLLGPNFDNGNEKEPPLDRQFGGGNFDDGHFRPNQRGFRNQNFDNRGRDFGPGGQRLRPGNIDNDFNQRRGGNFDDDRNDQRFGNMDNFRNERDFGKGRFPDNRGGGPFGRGDFDNNGRENLPFGDDSFNQGPSERNYSSEIKSALSVPAGPNPLFNNPPPKSKVPSLFDITVEKPAGLTPPDVDRKQKLWEKYEKDDYYDDPFEEKGEDRDMDRGGKPWANNEGPWMRDNPAWEKPWMKDRINRDKPGGPEHRSRSWDREGRDVWENREGRDVWENREGGGGGGGGGRNRSMEEKPWINDAAQNPDLEKAQLSGYVGNILAKLGNFNVMPPNLQGKEGIQEESRPSDKGGNVSMGKEQNIDFDKEKIRNQNNFGKVWMSDEGPNKANLGPNQERLDQAPPNFGPKSFGRDDRKEDFNNVRDESSQSQGLDRLTGPSDERGPLGRFDPENANRFEGSLRNFDGDRRGGGFNKDEFMGPGRSPFDREEVGLLGRSPFMGDDSRGPPENEFFGRNNRGNFPRDNRFQDDRGLGPIARDERGPFGREDRGSFCLDERGPFRDERDPFGRDERGPFVRDERAPFGRDDRGPFGRDERGPFGRDDRGPFGRDERGPFGRGPFGRDDRGPFGRDERGPFGRDDRGPFSRDERSFGRGEISPFDRMYDDKGPLPREDGLSPFGRDDRRFLGRDERPDDRGRFRDRFGPRGFDGREPGERFDDDRRGGASNRFARGPQPEESEWNPQVFDYSQGKPKHVSQPEDFQIPTVVDYSHGEKKQTFDYGHGEKNNSDAKETKSFDYGHGAEAPAVIDYGHGGDKEASAPLDWKKEKEKECEDKNASKSPNRMRSRSPTGVTPNSSSSRSPPLGRYRRGSVSPPFRGRRSRSRDRFGRPIPKRNRKDDEQQPSNQNTDNEAPKPSFEVTTVLVEDLICAPGRETRPNKIVFIMRGLPGSGKTYVTKLMKDKEIEMGGSAPRILCLDDYFMTDVEKEETDPETGRKVKNKVMEYEYESAMESHYRGSLLKAFKKTISDGFFNFIIVDSINEKTKDYEEMWSFAKQKGFQVYVAEIEDDVTICTKRNIHKRTEKEIADLAKAWEETPKHYLRLDARSLLQADAIAEVEMEVVNEADAEKPAAEETKPEAESEANKKEDEEEDDSGVSPFVKSRWDHFENSEQKLDRLDGLKRRREGFHATMEDYLQLPDDFEFSKTELPPGKKRVRWADLEERRKQEKMRAIGFVVGQTDWSRMTDPTYGESALTRTKYI